MNFPELLISSAIILLLLVSEYMRPDPKFIKIWQIMLVIAVSFGAIVIFFPSNALVIQMKNTVQSICLPIFSGMIIREIIKIATGTFKYREEPNPFMRISQKKPSSATPNTSAQRKKKKYKK